MIFESDTISGRALINAFLLIHNTQQSIAREIIEGVAAHAGQRVARFAFVLRLLREGLRKHDTPRSLLLRFSRIGILGVPRILSFTEILKPLGQLWRGEERSLHVVILRQCFGARE